MASLKSKQGEMVLTRPGLYQLGDGIAERCGDVTANLPGPLLLVALLGDFLLATPSWARWNAAAVDSGAPATRPDEVVGIGRRSSGAVPAAGLHAAEGAAEDQRSCIGVAIDGRRPLGGIERLARHATIDVEHAGRRDPVRIFYSRSGPPIAFAVPVTATLHCDYSFKSLSGETAIRCGNCFSLFHKAEVWDTELDRCCPVCGATGDQGGGR